MQAFCVRPHPPRLLKRAGVLLHAAGLAAVLCYSDGLWRALWLAAWTAAALWFYRYRRGSGVLAVHIDTGGRAALETDEGVSFAVRLRPGSLISPYLMILHWQGDGRVWWQALTRDMTDADAWRRLTVWARWMQPADDTPPL
ncbi:toxin CptA [Neisseria sp. HSC-16F19]|nr:protein YgfX [Neisseria sp. HSC-16F19]MCP2041851.1 toxin CptA [Neisseria sp. HSC-16F19]